MTYEPISQQTLEQLRQQAKDISGSISLTHSAQTLWRHIADKNTLSKAVGMDAVDYDFKPNEQNGGSHIFVNTTFLGWWPARYWELPYEWIPPYYSSVERIYIKGPLRYLSATWESKDQAEGCELTVRLSYVPRGVTPVKPLLQKILQKMLAFHQHTDTNLPEHSEQGFEAFVEHTPENSAKAKALNAEWQHLMPNNPVPAKIAEYIHTVPDAQVSHMRPFAVAQYFQLPRIDVLSFCLLATREGFFNLSWDLICPSCLGAAEQTRHLDSLRPEAHCDVCNIQYDANFDQNVEVTFRPVERLRLLDKNLYCLNNPATFSHIWSQLVLDPGEQRSVTVPMPEGEYRLSAATLGSFSLHSQADHAPLDMTLNLQDAAPDTLLHTHQQLTLHLNNAADFRQTLRIERLQHREQAATAALVTSLQDFRTLFDAEVLRPGLRLGISNLAVLFSDLKDSTQLYENKGDATAFALVQTHFDIMTDIIRQHEGGIVKTIGDAVMAVFTHNEQAVSAALNILQAFQTHNQARPVEEHIIIKLGVHKGPCIALTMNDKLDYFGSNINRAARAQGQSRGNDLILSQAMYEDAKVQTCLQNNVVNTHLFKAELKGIEEAQTLYCVRLGAE